MLADRGGTRESLAIPYYAACALLGGTNGGTGTYFAQPTTRRTGTYTTVGNLLVVCVEINLTASLLPSRSRAHRPVPYRRSSISFSRN
jgi:hypothetical protein